MGSSGEVDSRADADGGGRMSGQRSGQMREGLPVAVGAGSQQEDFHGAFAADPQSPQQILGPEQVVTHYSRLARLYY